MKIKIFLAALIFLALLSGATKVNVSLEKENVMADEKVWIGVVIEPSEPVGGRIVVYKIDGLKYSMARALYDKPSPEQCLSCARDTPLSELLNRTFIFTPTSEGYYMVEANFGGVQDSVNFTVGSTSTSSTTVTQTTSFASSTTSTSSSTSSSTISSTTSSSIPKPVQATTSVLPERSSPANGDSHGLFYVLVVAALVVLIAITSVTVFLIWRSKEG